MQDFLPTLFVVVIGVGIVAAWSSRLSARDQKAILLGLFLHLGAAVAQILITRYYYGYGDMFAYHRTGSGLANLMRSNFERFAPEVWRLLWQQENFIEGVHGNGTATGSTHALSAFLCLLFGNSLWAVCMAVSLAAFSAQAAIYFALRATFVDGIAHRLAWASLYFPSVVFWTSGLLKETFAMAGVGWVFWAFVQAVMLRRNLAASAVALALGGIAAGLTKAYLLFAFAMAASVSFYAIFTVRRGRRFTLLEHPGRILAAALTMMLAVGVLGALFPKYSIENVANEAGSMRHFGTLNRGGSTFTEEEDIGDRSAAATVAYVPLGFASVIARPLLFEVRNPMMLLTAIEMTVLLVMLVLVLKRVRMAQILAAVQAHPILLFAAVYVLVLGAAVGISTVNLGTLARYRVPLLPFYGLILAALLPLKRARR